MELKTLKVSDKGQISIPQSIRNTMNISQGDELVLLAIEGKILLEKANSVSEKIKDDFEDIVEFNNQSLKEVWDNKDDKIWNSYLEK